MRFLSFFFLLFILCFGLHAYGDIRKNKLIQDTVKMSVSNNRYCFDINSLLTSKEAFDAFNLILTERHKKEHLDGILIYSKEAQPYYEAIASKLSIPLIFINLNNIKLSLKNNGRYIIGETILEDDLNIQNLLKTCEKNHAFVMEIVCITEILSLKARENLNAQIMSVFINRETQKQL